MLFIVSGLQPLPIILVLDFLFFIFFIQPFQSFSLAISVINQFTIKKFLLSYLNLLRSLKIKSNHN